MECQDAENLCKYLMTVHGLGNVEFRWLKTKRTLGYCGYRNGKVTYIGLSISYVQLNKREEVLDTILHEIAHGLDVLRRGKSAHDAAWRRIASRIGANPRACSDKAVVNRNEYSATCGLCGREYNLKRFRTPRKDSHCHCNRIHGFKKENRLSFKMTKKNLISK